MMSKTGMFPTKSGYLTGMSMTLTNALGKLIIIASVFKGILFKVTLTQRK